MVDLLGDHRADDTDIIRDGTDVRKKVGDFDAALAPFPEFRERTAGDQLAALQLGKLLAGGEGLGKRLAVERVELWLGIQRFEMRRSARHAEVNDAFRPCREMQAALALEKRHGRIPRARAEKL